MNRRNVLKTAGGIGVGTAAGGLGFLALSGNAVAQIDNLSITGSTITTDDGTIEDATVEIDVTGEYDGVDEDVTDVFYQIEAYVPESVGSGVYSALSASKYSVSDTLQFNNHSGRKTETLNGTVTGETSWSPEDFEATEDGSKKNTEVKFRVRFWLESNGEKVAEAQRTNPAVFTVNNEEEDVRTGGEGSTSMDGENQEP